MTKRAAIELSLPNPLDHPAVRAWRELQPERVEPEKIEILQELGKETKKRSIYRLKGVGPAGAAVIAKQSRRARALVERIVYQEILPYLSISAPRCYGFLGEPEGQFCWLFLEDVGEERFSPLNAEHRCLAAQWLARMHTSATRLAVATRLPDGGPRHYLEYLRSARDTIGQHLNNPALRAEDLAALAAIMAQLGDLESRWDWVEECCEGVPATLVHGDFRPRNVYVRTGREGTILLPIDWERAGWGVPAADLAASRGLAASPQIDVMAYWLVVRDHWPRLGPRDIGRLVAVGTIFRRLATLYWDSLHLAYEGGAEWVMATMSLYHAQLADVVRTVFEAV